MKGKEDRKIRFQPTPLSKIEEDAKEQEATRKRRNASPTNSLLPERRRSVGVNRKWQSSKVGVSEKWRQSAQSALNKTPKTTKNIQKSKESKGAVIANKSPTKGVVKDGNQRTMSPGSAVKATGKDSPSKQPRPKSNSPGNKDGGVNLGASKGGHDKDLAYQEKLNRFRNAVTRVPQLTRKYSGLMRPPSPEEDTLALPFGGSRRLSDTNLTAAQPATNVVYLINQAQKKRLKESINAQIAAVHDRVRKALEYAEMDESDEEQEEDTKFNTRSKRETMKYRNELVYRLREHIEDCHKRMVLITDVNNWIQAQQKELELELVSEDELDEETVQHHTGHKKIMYSLEALMECTSKISVTGQKLLEMAGNIMHASSKGKVEKIHVIDEKTMLTNKAKWDQAVTSILGLFDDAARWVKGAPYKSAIRNGKKQYQVIISAVDKRLMELAEMSKLAEDLQNKLMMSKEMINKFSKDADANKKLVDILGKELQALKSEMSMTLETNKKLTSQLTTLEGQVKTMKAEIDKPPPPPPPPRPPTPPTQQPLSPQASESSKQLLEKTRSQLHALEQEIQEYRMLVNNLSARIDELEDQLAKEQKRVQFLKESLDTEQQAVPPRAPEPVVELPPEPAPPPDLPFDSSSSYYKTLLSGMKKDFMVEVEKLKDHLKREQNRNDAGLRRVEQTHKDQIHTIMKDCIRVLRAIVHFRDQVANSLDKEGFTDSARQLQQLPKLIHDNVGQDPKDILMYMAENTVDYLHSVEVVLNHTMLAIKVMQKSGTMGSQPPVTQDQVFKQMEERMEEIRQPSKIRAVLKSPVKRIKSHGRRKDRQCIKKLEGMVNEFENKYVCLLDRYKMVWKLYNEQKQEMDNIQHAFDQTIRRKVKEKENIVVTAIKTQLKERRAIHQQQLQMSIADQRQNLQMLDKALDENKISRELHLMATQLLNQASEIPRKRFRYLIERYIAHRAVKDAENKVTDILQEETLTPNQKADFMEFMDQMQVRLRKGLSAHHQKMRGLEQERRTVFMDIWNVFNEVLLDSGVLLIQPVLMQTKKEFTRETSRTVKLHRHRKVKVVPGERRRQLLDLPTGLVGTTIPMDFRIDKPMWKKQPPTSMSPLPAVTTPLFLEMDVNRQRLLAKRKLKAGPKSLYPLAESRSFTISDKIKVDYISTVLTVK